MVAPSEGSKTMDAMRSKTLISLLWISLAVSTSAAMIIWFVEPGIIQQITTENTMVTEQLSEKNKVIFAAWWIIPLSMAFLTNCLPHTANRLLNLTFGVFFAIATVFHFVQHFMSGWFTYANLLILFFITVASILIAWYAWRLPEDTM